MTAPIVIIDYDAGNLRSVQRACAEVGATAAVSSDPQRVRDAERVIFPGVGAAGSAMRSLKRNGLDNALRQAVEDGKPVLGICLGLQISLNHSGGAEHAHPRPDARHRQALPAGPAGTEGAAHGLERGAPGQEPSVAAGHQTRRRVLLRPFLLSQAGTGGQPVRLGNL